MGPNPFLYSLLGNNRCFQLCLGQTDKVLNSEVEYANITEASILLLINIMFVEDLLGVSTILE